MLHVKNDGVRMIYINCSRLQYPLGVDGVYFYNFEVYIYLAWVLAFMIVFINMLCLVTMIKARALGKPSDILLKCMVFCDLLMGIFSVPFWIISLLLAYYSYPNCLLYRFTVFSGYFVGSLSFLTITLITLDRYVSIWKPYFYVKLTAKENVYKIEITFISFFALLGVGSLFLSENYSLQAAVLCLVFLIIFIADLLLYVKINQKIKEIDNYYKYLVGKKFATSNVTNYEKKGQVINLAMMLALVFSYCPYFVLQLLHILAVLEDDLDYALGIWGYIFISIKSLVNPILYCISRKEFRKKLLSLVSFKNTSGR